MPVSVDGEVYLTSRDVAKRFGVTPQTISRWIASGVVPNPPTARMGLKSVRYFPLEWLQEAEQAILGGSDVPIARREGTSSSED